MRGLVIGLPAALLLWIIGWALWKISPVFLTFGVLILAKL